MDLIRTIFVAILMGIPFNPILGQNTEFAKEIDDLYEKGSFEEIVSKSNNILEYARSNQDSTSAELLYFLGDAYIALDNIAKAIEVMKLELTLREQHLALDEIIIADMYSNLGYYNEILLESDEALKYYNKAIELYRKLEGEESEAYIETAIFINRIFQKKGQLEQARKTLKNLSKNSFAQANYESLLVKEEINLLLAYGSYYEANRLIDEKLKNYSKDDINNDHIELQILKADVSSYKAEYAEAEKAYLKALKLVERANLYELTDIIQNNLAILYSKIGQYDLAYEYLTEVDANDYIQYVNMAKVLSTLDSLEQAGKYFDKALNEVKNVCGTSCLEYAVIMKQKAIYYSSKMSKKDALNDFKESLDIASNLLNENNPEFTKYEFQLGKAYYELNQIKEAYLHIEQAYKLRKKYLSNQHPLYGEASKELAELSWYESKTEVAKEYYKETFDNYFAQIEAYFPALSEQEKANFFTNTLKPTFEEYNSFILENYDKDISLLSDMYNYQLATKGLIMYATERARDEIINSGDSALVANYQKWIATKEQIAKLYALTSEELANNPLNLDSLKGTANQIEKELTAASSEFSNAFQIQPVTWKDIQKQLKENEAAIEMIRFRKFSPDSSGRFTKNIFYAALLIDKQSKNPELIIIDNGIELENKYIKNYKNAIKYRVKDKYSYTKYWQPIAEQTKKYRLLYFSPDGIYNQISINSLYNNESKKYVLEEQNIQLLTNTKDLITLRNNLDINTANLNNAVLFGFPNYNKGLETNDETQKSNAAQIADNVSLDRGLRGSLSRYIRGNSLVTELPGTKAEVEKIDSLYSSLQGTKPLVKLENEADELNIKQVNNPKVLHIATHGFFLEDTEANLSNDEDKYAENPLLKSGMILAGANSFITSGIDEETQQDGILTAYEAMNLNLNNTQLVVLSACETGLGDLQNGEGVYGLRRAFFVAGADAIIMSLWSVDDAATQELMTEFYKNWLAGKSKKEAFKEAQIFTMNKYEDPYFWGAFVMVGE